MGDFKDPRLRRPSSGLAGIVTAFLGKLNLILAVVPAFSLEGEPLRRVMVPDPVVVAPGLTVAELIDGYIYRHAFEFFPVVEAGRLVGSVSLHEVRTVPPHARETTRVADILRPMTRDCVIDADASAAEALAHMQGTKRTLLIVVDGPRLVGVIALRDIMRLVSLKSVLAGTAHGD